MKFFGSAIVSSVRNGVSDFLNRNKVPNGVYIPPPVGLRVGMWVFSKTHGVGIVAGMRPDGLVEFHCVAPDRTTSSVVPVPVRDLRQARRAEIPAASRPDAVKAERMGYL